MCVFKSLLKSCFSIFVFYCMIGCHSNSNLKIIEYWQNKKIQIPDHLCWKSFGKDTFVSNNILNTPFKILIYIDSIGCSPCRLQLPEWKTLMNECKQSNIEISFLFVIHSSNYRPLESEFYFEDFSYPVIYDYNNDINKMNQFPKEHNFHTFLLDKDNKVLLVGSPINNRKMWRLYKQHLIN